MEHIIRNFDKWLQSERTHLSPGTVTSYTMGASDRLKKWCENNEPQEDKALSKKQLQSLLKYARDNAFSGIESFTDFLKEEIVKKEQEKSNLNKDRKIFSPLNQILYGPPGTGKTYQTTDLSLKICLGDEEYEEVQSDRKEMKEAFKELLEKGQIEFVTFHQSFSYEDFVEGIKPKTDGTGEIVTYPVEDGIFKKICKRAEKAKIKKSNFNEIYNDFINSLDENKPTKFETLQQSREFSVYRNSRGNIKFHANTEKAYLGVIKKEVLEHYVLTGEALDWPSYTKALGKHFKEVLRFSAEEKAVSDNYVLIIDEINRGNVASIFGELITLIEPDKRKGNKEETIVNLPYSKDEPFSVPSNLYIIGTMNTADRSVEALDTALRRRFAFKEIAPNPEILSSHYLLWELWKHDFDLAWEDEKWIAHERSLLNLLGGTKNNGDDYQDLDSLDWDEMEKRNVFEGIVEFNGLNFKQLLKTINERIELLLDKDHKIGHAYFLSLMGSEDCEDELKHIFYNKIIPLLEEYFYGDYGKIGLILGEDFVKPIEAKNLKFARFSHEDEVLFKDKTLYDIIDYRSTRNTGFLEAVRNIYIADEPIESDEEGS